MKRSLLLLALTLLSSLSLAASGPLVNKTYQGSFHNGIFAQDLQINTGQNSYTWLVKEGWSLNFRGKVYHFPALTGTNPLVPTTSSLTFIAKTPRTLPSLEDPAVGIYIYSFTYKFSGNSKQLIGSFVPSYTLVIVVNGKPTYYYGTTGNGNQCFNIVLKKK